MIYFFHSNSQAQGIYKQNYKYVKADDGNDVQFEFIAPGTLTASDGPSSVFVFINGVSQEPGSDYTLDIPNNEVVLNAALPIGDKIVITRLILLPSSVTFTAEQIGALTNSSEIDGGSF